MKFLKNHSVTTWILLCLELTYITCSLLPNEQQKAIYVITTLLGLFIWQIWRLKTGNARIYKPCGFLGWSIFAIALCMVGIIILYVFGLDIRTGEELVIEATILVGACLCLVIGQQNVRDISIDIVVLLKGLLHSSSAIVFTVMLAFLSGEWIGNLLRFLLEDTYSIGMLCIMTGILASSFYCTERTSKTERIYMGEALLSFIVLGVANNSICLHIMFFLLLFLLIEIYPQKEYVRRSGNILFCYLLIVSNLPLLMEYTKIFRMSYGKHSMKNGVALDLLLCFLGAAFVYCMDRTENQTKEEAEESLNHMQYELLCFMVACLLFLVVIVMGEKTLEEFFEGAFLGDVLRMDANALSSSLKEAWSNNLFVNALRRYGVTGGIYSICVSVLIYRQSYIGVYQCNRRKIGLFLLVILQGVAVLFMPARTWICGIFILLTAYLLRSGLCRNNEENIDSNDKTEVVD